MYHSSISKVTANVIDSLFINLSFDTFHTSFINSKKKSREKNVKPFFYFLSGSINAILFKFSVKCVKFSL